MQHEGDIPGRQTAVSGPHMAHGVVAVEEVGGWGVWRRWGGRSKKDLVGSVDAFIWLFLGITAHLSFLSSASRLSTLCFH